MYHPKKQDEDKPVVSTPGGVATKNSFVVFEAATTEQLIAAVRQVNMMEGATAWWLGDLGIAIQDRKKEELLKQAAELRAKAAKLDGSVPETAAIKDDLLEQAEALETRKVLEYRTELAEKLDLDPGYWHNCVTLARFYQPAHRNAGLKPKHHFVAMQYAGGDLKKAKEWLAGAEEGHLAASELRKQLAEERAARTPPTPPSVDLSFTEMTKVDKWAGGFCERVKTMSPEQAINTLTMLTKLRELVHHLEELAQKA